MVSQVNQLAGDLPRYQSTLREKIHSLRAAAAATGTLERASEVLQDLSSELDKPNRTTTPPLGGDSTTVRQADPGGSPAARPGRAANPGRAHHAAAFIRSRPPGLS